MNIFPYWVQFNTTVEVGGKSQPIRCFGRSLTSVEDALRFAQEKAARVQQRVCGEKFPKDTDYTADIREEMVTVLDPQNIVTRNRNGVEVLNSTSLCFIDIDSPRWEWRNLWGGGPKDPSACKERILKQVEARAANPVYRQLGFRIYETPKGIRLVVTGQTLNPRAPESVALLKDFHSDELYAQLCQKQNCYRARLTPKSYRMKYKGYKVIFPRTDSAQESVQQSWLAGYEVARRNFAACRFLREIGPVVMSPALAYHDERTRALTSLPLA